MGKKGEFRQVRMFRRVSIIHISQTPSDVAEIDFPDHGDEETSTASKVLRAIFHYFCFWAPENEGNCG